MQSRNHVIWGAGTALVVGIAVIAGCAASTASKTSTPAAAPASSEDKPVQIASAAGKAELSGNELWSQYCGLCHNSRSPADYSDAQWSVAVMHMRIQARLTGEEERKIRQYLQASN